MNKQIIKELENICGISNIISNHTQMSSYLTDWRNRYMGNAIAVAFPKNTQEIETLVKYCLNNHIAITPQGGNTSTCGGATPFTNYEKPQIIINLARMNKAIEVDKINQSITVEAGCTLEQVQLAAEKHGLYFPLCLASQGSCQIGGNIATNAGGVHVLKYGMMRDLTLGIEAVLANGKFINLDSKLRKNNTYLDVKQLLIGSEGTLGIISKATLKLYPIPFDLITFLIGINNLDQALSLLSLLRGSYLNNVCAFEIIKKDSQDIYNKYFSAEPLPFTAEWLILGELEINADFNLDSFISLIDSIRISLEKTSIASSIKERQYLWSIREKIPLAEKQHGYAVKHDISLPLGKIDEFLSINMPKLTNAVPNGYFSIFGHLGDGNLHYNLGINGASKEDVEKLEELISPIVYNDVVALKGSIAAEHGIGQAKKYWFQRFCPAENYQLLKAIKELLDPYYLFNPGKIFDIESTK